MGKHNGSDAVDSVILWLGILGWPSIFIGLIVCLFGFFTFEDGSLGAEIFLLGLSALILRAILKGFAAIVLASEYYIIEYQKKCDAEKAADEQKKE